jgi:isochorismate synthase
LTISSLRGVHDVVNNVERAQSFDAVVEVFDRAVASGSRAFLWSPPDSGAVFAAVGEGDAGLMVGALGFSGDEPPWRPARVVATPGAFCTLPRPEIADAAPPVRVTEGHHGALEAAPLQEAARSAWNTRVERARVLLLGGALRKVVLARAEDRTAPDGRRFDAAATFRALRAGEPGAFAFAVHEGGRTFLGASPERLASVTPERAVHTEALAGTAPRSTPPGALLASAKDREEHAFVVEAIVAALEPYVHPGSLARAAVPSERAFARVRHLHTPIAARLDAGADLRAVVRALHPTPAVGGTPRAAALAFLAAHEGLDRGPYAGPVGWMADDGAGCFAVGIRSAVLAGSTARLFAGAGLVAASDAAAEWAETALKLRTAAEALRTC